VVLNAAAGLWIAGKGSTPRAAAALASEAIDTGAGERLLEELAQRSHAAA
jgi:anthranilate phosphoribosyltransferase